MWRLLKFYRCENNWKIYQNNIKTFFLNGLQLRVNLGRLQLKEYEAKIKQNAAKAEENIRKKESNRKEKAAKAKENIRKKEAERITGVMKNMNAANAKRNREIMFSMTLLSIFMAAICYSNYYAIEYMLNGNANKPSAESALTTGAQFAKGSCGSGFYPTNVNVNSEEYKSKGYWGKKFAGWDPLTGMRGIITQECIEAAIDTIGGTLSKTGGRGAELIGHAGENIITGAKGLSRPTLHAVNVISCIAIVFATLIWKVMNAEKSSALRRELEGVANMSTKTPAQQKSYLRRAAALSVKLIQKVPVTPLGLVRLLPKPRIPRIPRIPNWMKWSSVSVRGNDINLVQNAHNNYIKLNNAPANQAAWIAKKVKLPRARVSVLLHELKEKEKANARNNTSSKNSKSSIKSSTNSKSSSKSSTNSKPGSKSSRTSKSSIKSSTNSKPGSKSSTNSKPGSKSSTNSKPSSKTSKNSKSSIKSSTNIKPSSKSPQSIVADYNSNNNLR